jgi:hypothetical protein
MQKPTRPRELTLRELWCGTLPRVSDQDAPSMPSWPPNAFALCAHALHHASAYARALAN